MANRKVATEAGAKFFGKPIGSTITDGDKKNAEGRKRPVTMHRLRSLQRQFIQAKRTDNAALMKSVNKQFKHELAIYRDITGEDVSKVLDDMDATPNEGFKESTEINDRDAEDGNKPEPDEDDSRN